MNTFNGNPSDITFNTMSRNINTKDIEKQLEVIEQVNDNVRRSKQYTETTLATMNKDMYKWLYSATKRKRKIEVLYMAQLYWERRLIRETKKLADYVKES
jgi:hypothetical protein